MKTFVALIGFGFLLAGCDLPDFKNIHLSTCVRQCDQEAKINCKQASISSNSPICFYNIEYCFHQASLCTDGCLNCEEAGTCIAENECNNGCAHITEDCGKMIAPCVEEKELESESILSDDCVDPLMGCVADCVAETEEQLKQ